MCINVGGIVTCAADETDGFGILGSITDFTINSGVTVDDSTTEAFISVIEILGNVTGTFQNNGIVIDLGALNDRAVFINGTVNNFINNGDLISGLGRTSVFISGDITSFENSGLILGNNTGVTAGNNITALTNTGTIQGDRFDGIFAGNDIISLTNSDIIQGNDHGILASNNINMLNNSGTIMGTTDFGVLVGMNITTLINSGTIQGGGDDGVLAGNDIMSVTNSGTIQGDDSGISAANNINMLNNSGMIIGDNREGILVGVNLTSLTNSGTIQGEDHGILVGNMITTLTNSGTIRGMREDGIVTGLDLMTLTNSGTIQGDENGVFVGRDINSLTNTGLIIGNIDNGIFAGQDIVSLINSGTIRGDDNGIFAGNDILSLSNSGTIRGNDDGIFVNNNLNSLTNSGMIIGNNNIGILVVNDILSLTNSGTILGDSNGVLGNNDIISLDNSGTIRGGFDAIISFGNIVSLTNSGMIIGGGDGVDADKNIHMLVNAGAIIGGRDGIKAGVGLAGDGIISLINAGVITAGPGFNAIISDGGANTVLTLNPGSNIFGGLDLGGGTNTLNVGLGHNIDHVFAMLPSSINPNGMPLFIDGNRVVVVNPGDFAFDQQDEMLFDLSQGIWDTVFSNIGNRRGPTNGSGPSLFNGLPQPFNLGATPSNQPVASSYSYHGWASAIGRYRDQDGDANSTSSRHTLRGLIAGLDGTIFPGMRLGGFFGVSETDIKLTNGITSKRTNESIFGGLYGSTRFDRYRFNFGFTAGTIEQEGSTRIVDNNRVNGLQTVTTGDVDGSFIAPEISLSRQFNLGTNRLEARARLGYAGVFYDGATETGGNAPVTIAERDLGIIHGRLELALLMHSKGLDGFNTYFSPYIGIAGRSLIDGDTQAITVLGQNLTFSANGDDDVGSAFAGMNLSVWQNDIFGLFADLEGSIDTTQSATLTGRAGFRWRF